MTADMKANKKLSVTNGALLCHLYGHLVTVKLPDGIWKIHDQDIYGVLGGQSSFGGGYGFGLAHPARPGAPDAPATHIDMVTDPWLHRGKYGIGDNMESCYTLYDGQLNRRLEEDPADGCVADDTCVSLGADSSFERVFGTACKLASYGGTIKQLITNLDVSQECQVAADRMATCALEPSKTEKDYVKELVRDGKPVKFDCAGLIEHFPDACYNGGDLVDECEVACKQAIMGCDAFVSKAKPDESWCSAANEEFVLKYAAGTQTLAAGAVDVDNWWNFGTADDTSGSHYSSLSTFLADVRGLCPVSCGVCDADAGGSPRGTAQVQAGLGFTETGANMAADRCLVVHDYDGARIASAPLRPAHDTTPTVVKTEFTAAGEVDDFDAEKIGKIAAAFAAEAGVSVEAVKVTVVEDDDIPEGAVLCPEKASVPDEFCDCEGDCTGTDYCGCAEAQAVDCCGRSRRLAFASEAGVDAGRVDVTVVAARRARSRRLQESVKIIVTITMPAYAAAAATTQLATKLADKDAANNFLQEAGVDVEEITFAPAMAEEWPADEPDVTEPDGGTDNDEPEPDGGTEPDDTPQCPFNGKNPPTDGAISGLYSGDGFNAGQTYPGTQNWSQGNSFYKMKWHADNGQATDRLHQWDADGYYFYYQA